MSSSSATRSALPIPPLSLFVLDTGTTGTEPSTDHLQSLSLLLTSTTFRTEAKYSTQIRPPTLAPHRRVPNFQTAWCSAKSFLDENTGSSSVPILIAHNAPFDAAFIVSELRRNYLPIPDILVSDSLTLARSLCTPPPAKCPYSQESLARYFDITAFKPHTSKYDVDVLAEILSHLSYLASTPLPHLLYQKAIPLKSMAAKYSSSFCKYPSSSLSSSYTVDSSHSQSQKSRTGPIQTTSKSPGYTSSRLARLVSYPSDVQDSQTSSHLSVEHSSITATSLSSVAVNAKGDELNQYDSARGGKVKENGYRREIWTTATGAYYHGAVDCVWLRTARTAYKVDQVAAHLKPCTRCWEGGPAKLGESAIDVKWMYLTKSDRYFHDRRNCRELDTSEKVMAVSDRPAGLNACPKCCESEMVAAFTRDRVQNANDCDSVSQSSEVNGSRPSESGRDFFITRSGKYYHEDESCWCLSTAKKVTRVSLVPSRYLACSRCVQEPWDTPQASVSGVEANVQREHRFNDTLDTLLSKNARQKEEIQFDAACAAVGDEKKVTKESSLVPFKDSFFRSRTGTRCFHVSRNCRSIRRRPCFPCFPLEEGRDPCRICALGLYQEWEAEGWLNDQ